jgi:rhodanese-related sulfurtransferase
MSQRISAAEAKKLQDEGWTYVDVRTEAEFVAGHPTGAVNIPVNRADFLDLVKARFPGDSRLVIGCGVGARAMHATAALEAAGYTRLATNTGGFEQWMQLKLPAAKGAA